MLTAAVFRVVHFSAGVNAFALTVNRWRFAALILLLLPIFPYGESPTNVSVVTVPVLRSRRPQHSTLPLQIFLVVLGMELQIAPRCGRTPSMLLPGPNLVTILVTKWHGRGGIRSSNVVGKIQWS